jgi:DNA-binding response OmpR family regulator
MPVVSKLTKCLLERTDFNEFQLLQAEDYALTRRISLEEALLFLEYVDVRQMGQCLSILHQRPYLPLLDDPAAAGCAKSLVPLALAQRYGVFPVRYDEDKHLLLLAVSDPADHALSSELPKALPQGVGVELCVASDAEIRQAIDVHYRGKDVHKTSKIQVPEDFAILPKGLDQEIRPAALDEPSSDREAPIVLLEPDRKRAGAVRTLLRGEGYRNMVWTLSPKEAGQALQREQTAMLVVNGTLFRPGGPWLREVNELATPARISSYEIAPLFLGQEYSYGQMSAALIEMAATWVRKSLGQNKHLLQNAQARVKYCKLLGLRLGMSKPQLDGVTLAAWLSSGGMDRLTVQGIMTPYNLTEILFPEESKGPPRVEAAVLKLILTYQMLLRKSPEVGRNIDLLRRTFSRVVDSADHEMMVETFLKILKEEEFLGRVEDRIKGHVLIVDPQVAPEAPLLLRLANEGYSTEIVRTAKEAAERLARGGVDLLISETELGETDGLKLCLMLKQWPLLAAIPVIVLTDNGDPRLHAECLSAGADDYLLKPADLEVLSLKIRRLLTRPEKGNSTRGVRGSLNEMSTVDFLQSLSAGEKDVEVVLERGQEQGRIFMRTGAVIHAELEELSGEEAFYAMIPWEEGEFRILPCTAFPPQTIQVPLESLLIEGFRRVDEGHDPEPEGDEE